MKVELITSYFYPFTGGIESVVMHLAQGLSKRGHTVVVHTGNTFPGSTKILPSRETYEKFVIKRYPLYSFSLFFPKLEFSDSVVSLHNYSALMNDYVIRRFPTYKKIMTPYGTITYNRSQRKYPFLSIVYDALLGKSSLFNLDTIVAMTEFERKSIAEKYPQLKEKIVVIPGGIDIVKPKKTGKEIVLPEKFFFSIGRIAPSKRFEDVLSVLQRFSSYHYVLAGGDSGYLSELQRIAQEKKVADRFHYIGKVTESEKAYLMGEADVFIMPSAAEAFSIASVEAFCYSSRVLGANSGGIVDVFSELEGELYTAGSVDSLSNSLKKMVKMKVSQKIRLKRKKVIQSKYSWDVVVRQYEQAFLK